MHDNSGKLSVEEFVFDYNTNKNCKTNIKIYEGKNENYYLIKAKNGSQESHKVVFDPCFELKIGDYREAYYCNTMSELKEIVQYLFNESLSKEDFPSRSEDILDQKDTIRCSCFDRRINR